MNIKIAAAKLRELPFEDLGIDLNISGWTEALNIHAVINAAADWIEKEAEQ